MVPGIIISQNSFSNTLVYPLSALLLYLLLPYENLSKELNTYISWFMWSKSISTKWILLFSLIIIIFSLKIITPSDGCKIL